MRSSVEFFTFLIVFAYIQERGVIAVSGAVLQAQ